MKTLFYFLLIPLLTINLVCNKQPTEPEVVMTHVDSIPVKIYDDTIQNIQGDPDTISIRYHFLSDVDFVLINFLRDQATSNVNFLNGAFREHLAFDLDTVEFHDDFEFSIMDIYFDYFGYKKVFYNEIFNKMDPNYCNVFVVPEHDSLQFLFGMTPVPLNWNEIDTVKDEMNCIFITYDALMRYETGLTVIHEMGHYLGLVHVFEMTPTQKKQFGINDPLKDCTNFMQYNCFVDHFTEPQLKFMRRTAREFRYKNFKKEE